LSRVKLVRCSLLPRRGANPRDKSFYLLARFGRDFLGAACRLEMRGWLVILLVDVGDRRSLCVVNDQPVGNPKRKV
jgi:hypothetical protein